MKQGACLHLFWAALDLDLILIPDCTSHSAIYILHPILWGQLVLYACSIQAISWSRRLILW